MKYLILALCLASCSAGGGAPLPTTQPVTTPTTQRPLYGALVHVDQSDAGIAAAGAAFKDLGLDLIVIGFVPGVYQFPIYDKWAKSIDPSHWLVTVALATTAKPDLPYELAACAKAFAARYPGVKYYQVLNEPNVPAYYPGGMNPARYLQYFNAVKAALPGKQVMGPNTSCVDLAYMLDQPKSSVIAFHPYGYNDADVGSAYALLQSLGYRQYWETEWNDGRNDAVAVWSSCRAGGAQACIYYQLTDSPDSPGSGLLDANLQRRPSYYAAKAYLGT